jgi:hypothetical protein
VAVIADIAVTLTSVTGRFSEGFRKAGKELGDFGERLEHLKDKVFNIANAEIVLLGKEMLEFAAHTYEAMEANDKLSARLGITVEQLHALHYAATSNASSAESMDDALSKLQVTLGKGSPETEQALAKVGLRIKDLKDLDAFEQLKMIADGMERLRSNADKTAFAVEIFGRGGAGMVSVLKDGAGAIEKAAHESEKLRGSLSQIQSDNIREAKENMEKLGLAADGVREKIAAKLAPTLSTLSILLSGDLSGAFTEAHTSALSDEKLAIREQTRRKLLDPTYRSPDEEAADRAKARHAAAEQVGRNLQAVDIFSDLDVKLRPMVDRFTKGFGEALDKGTAAIKEAADARFQAALGYDLEGNRIYAELAHRFDRPEMDLHAVSRGTFSGEFASGVGVQGSAAERSAKALDDLAEMARGKGLNVTVALEN